MASLVDSVDADISFARRASRQVSKSVNTVILSASMGGCYDREGASTPAPRTLNHVYRTNYIVRIELFATPTVPTRTAKS